MERGREIEMERGLKGEMERDRQKDRKTGGTFRKDRKNRGGEKQTE